MSLFIVTWKKMLILHYNLKNNKMKKITFLAVLLAVFTLNAQTTELFETFEDITTLTDWTQVNASDAPNNTWFQPDGTVFPANDGDPSHYLANNFNATFGSVINDWIILPAISLNNGDVMTFFTRTVTASGFPDRLEVRIDPTATNTLPVDEEDIGSFTELLLSINPDLDAGGYPEEWTQFTATVSGLSGATDVRFAFRYWVTDAGPSGANSNFFGIDTVEVTSLLSNEDQVFENFNYFVNGNELNLMANSPLENVMLHNVLGQQVVNQALNNNREVVDISALSTGIYIGTATIEGQNTSFKIVKK